MKLRPPKTSDNAGILVATCFLLLLIGGCVISPRRIVNESPSPTPTPDISPTPTPTATPTPTPTPMSATVPVVHAQFLFLGEADSPLLTEFRINNDGSLLPVPGSPFPIDAPALALTAAQNRLFVSDENGITAFQVDKETGSIQQITSRGTFMTVPDSASPANTGQPLEVVNSLGRFLFAVDINRAELLVFRAERGKLVALSNATVPISSTTTSIAIVKW